jgi:hypothetical protein
VTKQGSFKMKRRPLKANLNGFHVGNKAPNPFDQLSSIDDNLGFSLSDIGNALEDAYKKLETNAVNSLQTSIVKTATNAVNDVLGVQAPVQTITGQAINPVTGQVIQPTVQTQYVNQPMDKNLKIALIAGGALLGTLLLITTIKSISK